MLCPPHKVTQTLSITVGTCMCCVFISVYLSLQIFKAVGVRLVVVDVVTWTMGDPIQISDVPGVLLDNFRDYSPNLPQIYDSAMLFT